MPEVIYTKEKIEQILKEYGYTAIGEIKNIRTKIDCIDEEGYKFQIMVVNVLLGYSPSRFHRYNDFTLENILLYQEKIQIL